MASSFVRGSLLLWCLASLVLALVMACDSVEKYSGDGKLTDNGVTAATDRYVLDLGPLLLRSKGVKTYKIQNLPSTSFVVGIDIRPSSPNFAALEKKPVNSTLSISLVGQDGGVLFAKKSNLDTWTWSIPSTGDFAFVYLEGDHGSSFTPKGNAPYSLNLEIVSPDIGSYQYEAVLLAKSGGWK
ncbi:MAG: hypothetical protein AB7R40_25155 [Nitrospiraceae bacterium]